MIGKVISHNLNTKAEQLIKTAYYNKSNAGEIMTDFFSYANKHKNQSNALISFYSARENLNKGLDLNTTKKISDSIEYHSEQLPELKKQIDIFINEFSKAYPKTGENRISLLSQGAVTSDKVTPKSKITRAFVIINNFFNSVK